MARILLVEDQESYRLSLGIALKREGWEVLHASSGEEALERLQADEPYDVVITDLKMEGMIDGVEVIRAVKEADPLTEALLLTGYSSVETAIAAMREGAFDYVTKPFSVDELLLRVRNALERRTLRTTVEHFKRAARLEPRFDAIVGQSTVVLELLKRVSRVARADSTVLIYGESGTGKGLIARALHLNSPRRAQPFVEVNCAGIPDSLLESELFGHSRGAFTSAVQAKKGLIEEAHGGSFFLDEISLASPSIQMKLLKVLEDGHLRRLGENEARPIDLRFICATNADLRRSVEAGQFREDLYYRLNVIALEVPPLRERREDIPMLAKHFVEERCEKIGKHIGEISAEAMAVIGRYPWPGNVRELRNAIEHAVVMSEEEAIRLEDLPSHVRGHVDETSTDPVREETSLADLEKRHIAFVLGKRKDMSGAAKVLGISRSTLWRKCKEYGLRE
ncbi:MAG: sigma-54-dependent Fis family transcriptional regulator [Myxococcales bacterium]|nr:sigma-54-dependent Fis family transcriptional regulator [Myxococcales bacterium]